MAAQVSDSVALTVWMFVAVLQSSFKQKKLATSNNLDLNLVDYTAREALQQMVKRRKI